MPEPGEKVGGARVVGVPPPYRSIGKSDERGRRDGIGCAARRGCRGRSNHRRAAGRAQERVFVMVGDDVALLGEDGLADRSSRRTRSGQSN